MPHATLSLAGQVFGRLTAMEPVGRSPRGAVLWRCLCACGVERTVAADNLKRGATSSCGCLHREKSAARARNLKLTHGHAVVGMESKEYAAWTNAKTRCFNRRRPGFKYYGAIGRTMAPEWIHDFAAFFAHIGPHPGPGYSLDRWPDNEGNYEPGNVRWATRKQQANNQRPRRSKIARG